jgi:hypothetical protein
MNPLAQKPLELSDFASVHLGSPSEGPYAQILYFRVIKSQTYKKNGLKINNRSLLA